MVAVAETEQDECDPLFECWCPSCLGAMPSRLDKVVLAISLLSLGMFGFSVYYTISSWDDSVNYFETVPCGGGKTNTSLTSASSCQWQRKCDNFLCTTGTNVSVCVPPSVGCCNVDAIKVRPELIALGACNGVVDPWLTARNASEALIVVFMLIAFGLPVLCLQCECVCLSKTDVEEMKKEREKLEMTSL